MPNQKALLLNVSNLETFPVYPYAFIQVPAIAWQSGIDVTCKDLLGIPWGQWAQTITTLIEQHNPDMILISLRNTDTLDSPDYERDDSKGGDQYAYFPVERTRELIATIRQISDLKIAVGGFAFSLLPEELMRYLRPDFGVFEGPNDFFAKFENILKGNLNNIANLLFFQGEKIISNPRRLYAPLADAEYTSQAIKAMMDFYTAFPSPGFQGAAVEIMRGCNHHCVFCAEPHAKGARVRYRDLSAVMNDIEVLVANGINRVYIVSSELNPEGNEFILELADRIQAFNELQTEDRKVTWYGANYLLKFKFKEFERLYRSGFTGGWFDITALDDDNAHTMQTPYRNVQLLEHLKTYAKYQQKQRAQLQAQKASGSQVNSLAGDGRENDFTRWTMFLGNPATTVETIRKTLQVANQEKLSQLFGGCRLNPNIRVFDYETLDDTPLSMTYSVTTRLERTGYQQILPSFAYSPALLHHFGSEDEINKMFIHIADTYLSTKYLHTRDWIGFLKQNSAPDLITTWVREFSIQIPSQIESYTNEEETPIWQSLFAEEILDEEIPILQDLAKQLVDSLLSACLDEISDQVELFGFPTTLDQLERMTPYELATIVFNRWYSEEDLIREFNEYIKPNSNKILLKLAQFAIKAMLYKMNILVHLKYRELFI